MKKLLSFVIVAMMIVSSIVPVFAVAEAPAAPAETENWFTVWAEDTEYDVENPTQYLDIYINVANNHELAGFEYLKFYCVYPACLTLANTQTGKPAGNSFMQSSWLTASTEHTEPDGNFIRSLYTLMGYDVGDGDETMTPEQQATYDARTEELLGGGKKWTSPLMDIEIFEYDDELEDDVQKDYFENGRLLRFRFTYDAELNKNNDDLTITLYADPEGALHSPNAAKPEWNDEWAHYEAFGATVDIKPDKAEHTHTPGEAVEENVVPATCAAAGSKDVVVYCTECGEELSRETVAIEKLAHTPAAAVEENVVPATCTAAGSKDLVVYCSVCGEELSREAEAIEKLAHTPAEAVDENVVASTCTVAGSKDEVVYCTVCGAEISREKVDLPLAAHVAGRAKIIASPTVDADGLVRYRCSVCGEMVEDFDEAIPALNQAFEVSIDDATAKVGDAVTMTVDLQNTQYGIASVQFYVYYDEAITDMDITIGDVYADALDELSVVDGQPDNLARFLDGYEFDTTGKTLKKVVIATEDDLEVMADGAIVNLAFTAPEAGEYAIGILTTDDWVANYYKDGKLVSGSTFIEYSIPTDIPATLTVEEEPHVHTPGEAVEENVVPATCAAEGSKDLVVYCTECGEELSRETVTIDKIPHTPAAAVEENVVPATCAAEGSKDIVVYCEVCGEELSRETETIEKIAHTPAAAVEENVVPATCAAEGSKDLVVYCEVCGEELSRETETIEKIAHTPAAAVEENVVPATCAAEGSKDLVVYCEVCGEELSRETETIEKIAHTPAAAVEENVVPATCAAEGSKDLVVYCEVCGEELSRETETIEKIAHTPAAAVEENVVPATCAAEGSKDLVVYCEVCGEELSREAATIEKIPHTPGEWVVEGEVENQYCTVCGELLDTRAIVTDVIDLAIVPGSRVASAEIDNEARVINVVSKKDQKYISYSFKLDGKDIKTELTLDDAAFAAGNTLMIKSVEYNADTDAAGIRYVKSYAAGGFEQTYEIIFTVDGKDYTYTVNVTFDHSPAASGVEPGYTANAELTGFVEGDDHTIQVVAQEGADWVAFRLLLAKGVKIAVKSGNVHTYQSTDKGNTYVDNGNEVNPDVYAYFRTYKEEVDNYEYDLTVTYENGDSEDFHVVVSFPEA